MKCVRISIVFTLVLVSVILSADANSDTSQVVTDPISAAPQEDVATVSVSANGNNDTTDVVTNTTSAVPQEDASSSSSEEEDDDMSQLKELCLKNANLSTFDHAMAVRGNLRQCIFSRLSAHDLDLEVEAATSVQELRVVARKYCSKAPQMLECVKNYTAAVGPCFDDHKTQTALDNLFAATANTACLNDGEQLAQVIADGGVDCVAEQPGKLKICKTQFASNLASIKNNTDIDLNHELKEETQCQKSYRGLQSCVIQNIGNCKPSVVNLLDSLFNATLSFVTCGNSTDLPITLDLHLL